MVWTQLVGWMSIILAAICLVTALSYHYKAHAHLANDEAATRRQVRRMGPFAGKELFSETGWRYWKRTFQLAALALVFMIIGGLLIAPSYR